jgi:hypothetical protein
MRQTISRICLPGQVDGIPFSFSKSGLVRRLTGKSLHGAYCDRRDFRVLLASLSQAHLLEPRVPLQVLV